MAAKAPIEGPRAIKRDKKTEAEKQSGWSSVLSVVCTFFILGYMVGYAFRDTFTTPAPADHLDLHTDKPINPGEAVEKNETQAVPTDPIKALGRKWPGDSVHTLVTSSGDGYQNFQTRILYATYKMVQKEPGGDKMTGFTRILHRTVPDILMDEVPTFHVWNVLKPQCDGWCDYPVANRPPAIWEFFKAAAKNESMIMGAWIMMIECDYVFMRPAQAPGNAWDPSAIGMQYHFDYILPQHPDAVPWIQKLYGPGKNVSDVPPSGPAPVTLRFWEWYAIVPDYVAASARMEADEPMKKALQWVREMYAWDVAVAMHKDEIKVETSKPPTSRLIVQPPFDEGLFNASMAHYTWGSMYYKNKKEIYRWEKRDYSDMKFVVKVPKIPMPPEFQEGILLEFDAPLTRARHDFGVRYLAQMNRAIDTLPELGEELKKLDKKIADFKKWKDETVNKDLLTRNMVMVPWSAPRLNASDGVVAGGKLDTLQQRRRLLRRAL